MKIFCAYSELWPLDKIIPNPKNDNDHKQEHAELLAKFMNARGIRHPIIISKRSGFIVAGHLRLMAAQLLGLEKYPVDIQEFENEAEEYAFLSGDNNIARYAEFNESKFLDNLKELDIPLEEFKPEDYGLLDFELPNIEVLDPRDEDEVPEVKEDPITKRGDIWLLGKHRLKCGDSTMIDDVEKLMNGEKADMVFTDPLYGDDYASCEFDRTKMGTSRKSGRNFVKKVHKIKNDSNIDFLKDVGDLVISFCKKEAPKIVFFKWSKWEKIKYSFESFGNPSSCCVWDREKIASAQFIFNPCHEFAFFWGSLAKKQNKSNLKNVWRCAKEKDSKKYHPTVKPIEICENAIDASCITKGLVLDAFLGSGSTLIACEKTNRKCFGMELDEHYCDVIINRYMKFTGKDDVILESTGEKYNDIKMTQKGKNG